MSTPRSKREQERIRDCLARLPGWQFDERRRIFHATARRSLGETTVALGKGLALTLDRAVEARVELALRAGAREWTAGRLEGLPAIERWLRKSGDDGEKAWPSSGPAARGRGETTRPSVARGKKPRRGAR